MGKKFLLSMFIILIALIYAIATQVDVGSLGKPSAPPAVRAPGFESAESFPVERVVDGDTIIIRNKAGEKVTVRLKGVDTPESVHPTKPVEFYGKEASRFTRNLLSGERVFLIYDQGQPEQDKFGRLLAYVYRAPDGLFVNAELIRQGYAHAYTAFPFKYQEEFRQLERFARQSGKGLWGEK